MRSIECVVDVQSSGRPVPTVVSSEMPSFKPGDKMDIGQMVLAWKKGFQVCITPNTPGQPANAGQVQSAPPPPLTTR